MGSPAGCRSTARPSDRPRAAGREPSRRSDSSAIGVTSRKNDGEPRVVVDERPIRLPRRRGQLVHDRRADRDGRREPRVVLRRRRQQDRRGDLLEMPARDDRVRVVGGDDLALLGQLEAAVDRARRLPEDRPVRRPAAAPDRAAAAVEERQLDAVGAGDRRRAPPGPDGASRPPPGTPIPCSSRSSRASPPGDRRARPGGAVGRVARAGPRGSDRPHPAPRSISNSGHDVE